MNSQPEIKNIAGAKRYAMSIFVAQASEEAIRKITNTATNSINNHQNLLCVARRATLNKFYQD
jgi:hypothetical protein